MKRQHSKIHCTNTIQRQHSTIAFDGIHRDIRQLIMGLAFNEIFRKVAF